MTFPKTILTVLFLSLLTPVATHAQALKTLIIFDGANGARPVDTPLVQGTDGEFYGTTLGGGFNGAGTVFKIDRLGKLTTLYSFCSQSNCTDGSGPYGGLVLGRDGGSMEQLRKAERTAITAQFSRSLSAAL